MWFECFPKDPAGSQDWTSATQIATYGEVVYDFIPQSEDEDSFVWIRVAVRPTNAASTPTFELQAQSSGWVTLSEDPVDVPDPQGGSAGIATVEPDDDGDHNVYRIEIKLGATNLTWQLRITAEEAVAVNAVGSDDEGETLLPWVRLPQETVKLSRSGVYSGADATWSIAVSNWGTRALTIDEAPGTLLGGADSAWALSNRPDQLAPGERGELRITSAAGARSSVTHKLRCSDTIEAHQVFHLSVVVDDGGDNGGNEPIDFLGCSCGCGNYVDNGSDRCRNCGHSVARHRPT